LEESEAGTPFPSARAVESVNADDVIVLILEFSFELACDRVEGKGG
jgi:hypothetical protein